MTMKEPQIASRYRTLLLWSIGLFLLCSCAAHERIIYVSDNYNKAKYKRIGVLVVRTGNVESWSGAPPITLETDYARRVSRPWKSESEPSINVFIENEVRLLESIPNYPHFKPLGRFVYQKYYGNISPQIRRNVLEILKNKGYSTVDVAEFSKSWSRPYSEMTVADILESLKDKCEALFILHYVDFGPYEYDDIRSQSKCEGFSSLAYTVSMFDIATRERIVFVDDMRITPYYAIAGDPEIMSNPKTADKVVKKSYKSPQYYTGGSIYRQGASISLSFTEEEIIALVMKYIRKGIEYKYFYDSGDSDYMDVSIRGLEHIIP